jgi:hypothetical protein
MRLGSLSLAFLSCVAPALGQIVPASSSSLPSNVNITPINQGVTLSPTSVGSFINFNVGPINGITYSTATAYVSNSGGVSPWINIHFDFSASGLSAGNYSLAFIVSNVMDPNVTSGLAIDGIASSTNVITEGFEATTSVSGLPSGWVLQGGGTRGLVSGAITGFSAVAGSQFAFIDTGDSSGSGTISMTPLGGTTGTILRSPEFNLTTGTTLDLKVAFFSNDGSPFYDFGLVQLFAAGQSPITNVPAATLFTAVTPTAVPEPGGVALGLGCAVLVVSWRMRRTLVSSPR